MLAIHTPGGIGRYARILGAALLEGYGGELHLFLRSKSDMSLILRECAHARTQEFLLKPDHHIHCSKTPFMPRYFIHQVELGFAFASLRLDAYLDPDFILPSLQGVRCACTVHDLTPFTSPKMLGPKARLIYGRSSRPALAKAYRLLTGSPHILDSFAKLYPKYLEKMRVVEPCLAPSLAEASASAYQPRSTILIETEFGEVQLPQPFILHVGVPGPRKNTRNLIKAFGEAKLRMFPHRLVFVGGKATPLPRLSEAIPQVVYSNGTATEQQSQLPEILYLGRVSDDDLVALYRHAHLLVLPSLEEGFGYPVLEALAFRTPALATKGTPLSHLPGVAVIDDPMNYLAMAEDLEVALRDLPRLSAEISSSFSLAHYGCERYLEELLAALT